MWDEGVGSAPPIVDVVLIGPRLAHNENQGLGFLVAALRRAGLHAVVAPLHSWVDMAPIAELVRAACSRPWATRRRNQ